MTILNKHEEKVFIQLHRKKAEIREMKRQLEKAELNLKFLGNGVDNDTFQVMYDDYLTNGTRCSIYYETLEEFLVRKRNFELGMPIENYSKGGEK